jgi:hypothetical protein
VAARALTEYALCREILPDPETDLLLANWLGEESKNPESWRRMRAECLRELRRFPTRRTTTTMLRLAESPPIPGVTLPL